MSNSLLRVVVVGPLQGNFYTTGAISGTGTAYHSGAPEFIPDF